MDKKKLAGILLVIILIATGLRFLNINKTEGMWNDEYLTWEIAKAAFPVEFFQAIMRNCHAPLHYIYLKLWMLGFGDSDVSLRMSSLVPGVLSVLMMFFCGRHLSKKTSDSAGLFAAGFCAISSFLIYFSQEVRIYSLLFLLSAINVYFALKTLDNPSKKNCVWFAVSSLLVMLEHTIGFVFVFFSSLGVILFANKKTKFKKYLLTSLLIALVLFIPVGIFLYNVMFNQQYFSQWWAPFSWAKLAYFFTDLFSPYLVNITNAPPSFWSSVYNGVDVNFGFVLFALIPLSIGVLCMVKSIFSPDKNTKYFTLVSCGVFLTVFVASLFGKILFLTKYMIEIYPPLILLAVGGLVSFKNRGFKTMLATIFCVLSLFYILVSPYSPVKLVRKEGQNIPIAMLKALDCKKSDKVVFLYYPKERFEKYSNGISDDNNVSHISKYDYTLIKDRNESTKSVMKTGKTTYKNTFLSMNNPPLDNFLKKNVFSSIKKGDKFFLVDFAPVTIFDNTTFKKKLLDEEKYNETPFLYLAFSYIRNYILAESQNLLTFDGMVNHESWRIFIFEKT